MKPNLTHLVALCLAIPAAGCASRVAPFDDLDQSSVTILKLQGQETAAALPGVTPGGAGMPIIPIPGLTPEQQAQIQAGLQSVIPGIQSVIPGLQIPGMTMPGQTPVQQQAPRFNNFVILAQTPIADEDMKDELLDVFGSEESFNANRGPCFTPGMGVVFSDPKKGNIELMVSFSCNRAAGGQSFRWPHANDGLAPEASAKLRQIYEQMYGPLPATGGV